MLTSKEAREIANKVVLPLRLEYISHRIKLQAEKGCFSLYLREEEMNGILPGEFSKHPYNYRVINNENGYIISWE